VIFHSYVSLPEKLLPKPSPGRLHCSSSLNQSNERVSSWCHLNNHNNFFLVFSVVASKFAKQPQMSQNWVPLNPLVRHHCPCTDGNCGSIPQVSCTKSPPGRPSWPYGSVGAEVEVDATSACHICHWFSALESTLCWFLVICHGLHLVSITAWSGLGK